MKLKQLESLLGEIQQFSNPKVLISSSLFSFSFTHLFNQHYIFPADSAGAVPYWTSHCFSHAENSFGDVSGKVVADLGCGCGTLGAAAAILGAEHVTGIDIDPDSLEIASSNAEYLEFEMDLVLCDVKNLGWRGQVVDTIVMNPPFGTRRKGADMEFLSAALKHASKAVYSLHKTSTRDHIKRAAVRDYGAESAEVLCELRYDVPQLYKFHKRKEVDIAVDLWRFVPRSHRENDV